MPAGVDEQPGQIDAVARQRVAHQAVTVIVADRADVVGALAESREQPAAVAASLADAVHVAREVGLDRPVDVVAREVDVGVDTRAADHHGVQLVIHACRGYPDGHSKRSVSIGSSRDALRAGHSPSRRRPPPRTRRRARSRTSGSQTACGSTPRATR